MYSKIRTNVPSCVSIGSDPTLIHCLSFFLVNTEFLYAYEHTVCEYYPMIRYSMSLVPVEAMQQVLQTV